MRWPTGCAAAACEPQFIELPQARLSADRRLQGSAMNIDKEIDTRGLNCPLPILKAKKALTDMQTRPAAQGGGHRRGLGAGLSGFRQADRQRAGGAADRGPGVHPRAAAARRHGCAARARMTTLMRQRSFRYSWKPGAHLGVLQRQLHRRFQEALLAAAVVALALVLDRRARLRCPSAWRCRRSAGSRRRRRGHCCGCGRTRPASGCSGPPRPCGTGAASGSGFSTICRTLISRSPAGSPATMP